MKWISTILLLTTASFAQLFVSELERNPIGSETETPGGKSNEYIELVNLSSEAFTIADLSLFDGDIHDALVPKSGGTTLLPGKVLMILDQDYFPVAATYPIQIDPSAAIATVNHTSICGGLSGSDGFQVLYKGTVVATLSDSTNEDGKFLFSSFVGAENDSTVLAPTNFFGAQNWSEQHPSAGTVGGVTGSLFHEFSLTEHQLQVTGKSFGKSGSAQIIFNGLPAKTISLNATLARDSVELPNEIQSIVLTGTNGTDDFADTLDLSRIRVASGAVQISEISPRSEIEWIELHNRSTATIDLTGWKLYNDEDTVTISSGKIAPDEYLVLADKSLSWPLRSTPLSLFSLDNYHDTIRLDSHLGKMDSVCWEYTKLPKWTTETLNRTASVKDGFAEKTLMLAAATPGAASLMAPDNTPFTIAVKPQLFSPNGDGKDDSLQIDLTFPAGFTPTIRIFSSGGTELRRIDSAKLRSIWDGTSDSGSPVRRGPLVVIAEFSDESGKKTMQRTGAVLWR